MSLADKNHILIQMNFFIYQLKWISLLKRGKMCLSFFFKKKLMFFKRRVCEPYKMILQEVHFQHA